MMKNLLVVSMMCLMTLTMTISSAHIGKDAENKRESSGQYIDLGLPSGTLWKDTDEEGGFYTYEQAKNKFGKDLPTKKQFDELIKKCQWTWIGNEYIVTGPNGNSIVLPASGHHNCIGGIDFVDTCGSYWSSTSNGPDNAWYLHFEDGLVVMCSDDRCPGFTIRLVRKK